MLVAPRRYGDAWVTPSTVTHLHRNSTGRIIMMNPVSNTRRPVDRRSFMRTGLLAGGAAAVGAGLLANGASARAQERESRGRLNQGDAAILRFLAAAELIESDLWI